MCRLHPRGHFLWYIISKVGLSYEPSLLRGLLRYEITHPLISYCGWCMTPPNLKE